MKKVSSLPSSPRALNVAMGQQRSHHFSPVLPNYSRHFPHFSLACGGLNVRPLKLHVTRNGGPDDVYTMERDLLCGALFCCPFEMTVNRGGQQVGKTLEDCRCEFSAATTPRAAATNPAADDAALSPPPLPPCSHV